VVSCKLSVIGAAEENLGIEDRTEDQRPDEQLTTDH